MYLYIGLQSILARQVFVTCFHACEIYPFPHSLPPAVAYSLLVQLTHSHPLNSPPSSSSSDHTPHPPLSKEAPDHLTAHVLYCHWVVRFLTHSCLPVDARRGHSGWDITCATPDQIRSIVRQCLINQLQLNAFNLMEMSPYIQAKFRKVTKERNLPHDHDVGMSFRALQLSALS